METVIQIVDQKNPEHSFEKALVQAGWQLITVKSPDVKPVFLAMSMPSALLLDMDMPARQGWELLRILEKIWGQSAYFPVFGLTAMPVESGDVIRFLDLGGEDIISTSLPADIFLARLRSCRRKYGTAKPPAVLASRKGLVQIQCETRDVLVSDAGSSAPQSASLTPKEFGLLNVLLRRQGRVFNREDLLQMVWGSTEKSFPRTVDKHIETLRRKLGLAGDCVKTISGIGYKFEEG